MAKFTILYTDKTTKDVDAESYQLNDSYFDFWGESDDAFAPNKVFSVKAAVVESIEQQA